ncbi:MAG: small acid-soluble spore protein SspI [Bacilli bacterium]|jgi:small acid-soluble spore protein I (minor)
MEIDIRNYIYNNFKGNKKEDIKSSIIDSLNKKEEVTLPGLGVFFEILWNHSNQAKQEEILSILENSFSSITDPEVEPET